MKPLLPDYSIYISPAGGDAAVAGSVRAQVALSAILFFLLAGSVAAGSLLLWRSAKAARAEARQKTDFLSNVSHELKTPLTSMTLFSEMLAAGALDSAAAAKAASTILKESKRLASLIDGLLEFSRLDRGTAKFSLRKCDLIPVVEEAMEAFAPSFPRKITLEGANLQVSTDPAALRRILDCILENAAKYAPGGPVKIDVRTENGFAVVAVADEGPGIPPQDAKHVFERFWRGDDSVTRTVGGTGLGLAIARETALALGGSVSLKPNRPHGCIFAVFLPLEGENG